MKKLLLLTILLLLFVCSSVDKKEENSTPELLQVTTIEAQRCEMMIDSNYCD